MSYLLWGRNLEVAQLSSSGSGSLVWFQSGGQLRLQSTEGFIGAGGCPSEMVNSHGCWQEVSVSHTWRFPCNMAANSLQSKQSKRGSKEEHSMFHNQVSQGSRYHFHFLLFIRSQSLSSAHILGERNLAPPLKGRSIKTFMDIN